MNQMIGPDGDQGEQSEQRWCCAQDGEVRPLPLRFHAEMHARFLKRCFHAPARDEPAENLLWPGCEIGAEKGLWFALAGRIADQHPPDGCRR
jgi:hypothetical protein